jgi:hypothetical protein
LQDAFKVTVAEAGHNTVGGVVSTRVTLNVQFAVFPDGSVAVSVTMVVPVPLTIVPAAGDCVTVTNDAATQSSETVAKLV